VRLSIVRALCLAGGLCGLVSACASSTTKTKKLSYGQTAKANYDKGMEELEDESYPEAVRYFSFVKSRFPFSQYATLAELRMADALFEQEKYAAAVDAYKLFISFHPTHPKVVSGYVGYRVCEAQLKQIPEDWFLIPPSHEKDQTTTRQAMSDLLSFMRSHPEGKYFKKVQKLYRQCLRRLVAHELYVARFYLERDKPQGDDHAPGRDTAALPGCWGRPRGDVVARSDLYEVGRDGEGAANLHCAGEQVPRRRKQCKSETLPAAPQATVTG
jgi:outer membrane protein assembly factor BamD